MKPAARGDQHFMFRRVAAPLLAVALLLAAGATAEARVFRGDTSQGRHTSLVVGSDNLLRTARINWRARCRRGRVVSRTFFLRPHAQSTPDAFFDTGTYRRRQSGGFRLRFTATVRGRRIASGRERWRGTFRVKVLVTRRGRYVDTCRVRGLRWSARLVR
ncbi:MAG: hypothetical protein ACR2MZ_10010 [Candidatus Dormibacter sp.]|uniref:hypothetical protein n=1 Tax=Candidatus Dormibacter sp. TaxID=2973982 RepID=UPI003D9BDCB2